MYNYSEQDLLIAEVYIHPNCMHEAAPAAAAAAAAAAALISRENTNKYNLFY